MKVVSSKILAGAAMVAAIVVLIFYPDYSESRRIAHICSSISAGEAGEAFIRILEQENIRYLDSRNKRKHDSTHDEEYIMTASPPTPFRRTCTVWLEGGIIARKELGNSDD